nr:MAG TPA_asm: hypothetical protein [Caudoviricetes sp.]
MYFYISIEIVRYLRTVRHLGENLSTILKTFKFNSFIKLYS